jgi:ribonuclease-3
MRRPTAASARGSSRPCGRRRRDRRPRCTTPGIAACSAGAGSLPPLDDPARAALEARLGHRFADPSLLELALTHSSRANEEGSSLGNERLEFLGDAVLHLVVRELLMELRPRDDEGRLHHASAALVNDRALAERARALGVQDWIRLGRGEESSGGRERPSNLAAAFEAIAAALYLDAGLAAVRAFVEREFREALARSEPERDDAKSRLQELLHARRLPAPRYATTAERGPAHRKEFFVEVRVAEELLGSGRGSSKRDAEQEAARAALARLGA